MINETQGIAAAPEIKELLSPITPKIAQIKHSSGRKRSSCTSFENVQKENYSVISKVFNIPIPLEEERALPASPDETKAP
ncbi:MAG TPA: hypothetical protein PLM53_07335 [Spirochaetota bacterium]|nr:hypothetical protein [Spirochaetota bacterium]HPC42692.1 hypothetical protein [Spirochaetota bacterium]HPL19135.1 hypothetical protein [Spirochaetota bacterium]HQF07839.1 hypothetical protein [Spirochaetota bacterium]HQH96892.1 hypothetical protein [Spirochaetota bacterium]